MKKSRRNKFKIPGRTQELEFATLPFVYPGIFTKKDQKKILRSHHMYLEAMRDFYNSIADENLKVSSDTKFIRLSRTSAKNNPFNLFAFAKDVLFHFIALKEKEESMPPISALIEITRETIDELDEYPNNSKIKRYIRTLIKEGYTPFKEKVLCVIEEVPSGEFLNRDEITIDLNNDEFLDWAEGIEIAEFVQNDLEHNLGLEKLKVKVINKVNNPEAYNRYLKLKQVIQLIDDEELIGT